MRKAKHTFLSRQIFFLVLFSLPLLMSITYLVEEKKENQSTILISILNDSFYFFIKFGFIWLMFSAKIEQISQLYIVKTKKLIYKKRMQLRQKKIFEIKIEIKVIII